MPIPYWDSKSPTETFRFQIPCRYVVWTIKRKRRRARIKSESRTSSPICRASFARRLGRRLGRHKGDSASFARAFARAFGEEYGWAFRELTAFRSAPLSSLISIADSRQNVDSQLKIACREFIVMASRDACGPLLSFLDKADTFLSMEESQEAALPRQPYATPEALREVVGESTRVLKEKLPKLLSSLALYLANKDTEGILFRPIQANILGAYQRMQEILRKHYHEEEEIRLIACPSVEQISLLISTMTESFTSTATSARKPPRPIPTTRDSQRQGEGAAVVTENGVRASHVANGPNQKNEVQ
ncbi:unnamed protein product [Cyprideis torosa]|uniref:Uncharacterized protein n=1 Tax=Cyprideis torosa TaxID=163714 RepID=A0A7R8WI38_9CRUS|nr:unnamed protein product [Cyprideis torosa]CAG0894023.1 unnamed protein product [Cyprideis torosa]